MDRELLTLAGGFVVAGIVVWSIVAGFLAVLYWVCQKLQ